MKFIYALILGIVQGVTEFLPVSSSGHMILFKHLFDIDTEMFGLPFDIAVHVATLIAVFVAFREQIFALIKKPFQKYVYLIVIATIPAVIVGLFFNDFIDEISASGGLLGISFIVTSIVLIIAEKVGKRVKDDDEIKYTDAGVIGIAQGIAVMPGISRSGSTLAAGLIMGLKKETALSFAFIMSIPVILGSAVLGVKDVIQDPANFDVMATLVGMIAAGLSGYASIKFMLDFFKKRSLIWFSAYVGILGVLVVFDQLVTNIFFEVFIV
ncbi:MAG: undecaprenyl-diphosphate phosphatase [Clostridia bacterium]|nr:undecaprenyl-diphosphate phosphatase [Clostridia bacterium]